MPKEYLKKMTKLQKIALAIVLIYIILAILAPYITPYEPNDFSHPSLAKPSAEHWLGTTEIGHDIFSLLLYGFRSTVFLSLSAGILTTLIGTILAFFSLYSSQVMDRVLDTIANLLLTIPDIIVILFLASITKPGWQATLTIIVAFSWPRVYKNTRAKLKDLMQENRVQYILSMKGNIFDLLDCLWREIWSISAFYFIRQSNRALTYETTLSFLGIGDPFTKTWGKLIHAATNYVDLFYDNSYLWYLLPVVVVLILFVVALTLLVSEVPR